MAGAQQGRDASWDLGNQLLVPALRADVVGAGQDDHDLWVDPVQFAVLDPPEDVLDAVSAPAEVPRVPAVEVLVPVPQ
jgi:hypothetical protein